MHRAADDEYIGEEAQRAIHETLKARPDVAIHTYLGCQHAFARPGGQHFDDAAAESANQRTHDFLRRPLASPITLGG